MRKLTKNKGKLQGCAILNLCQVYWGDIKIFQLKRVKVYIGGQKISWGGENPSRNHVISLGYFFQDLQRNLSSRPLVQTVQHSQTVQQSLARL